MVQGLVVYFVLCDKSCLQVSDLGASKYRSKQCKDEVRFFVVSGMVYIVKTVC